MKRYLRSQRSQSMTEFALIAPILFLFIFVMVDFGRGIYYYVTIQQAVHEGARVAVRWSYPLPADATVEQAVQQHAIATFLANPCRNGPIYVPGQVPPANEGWIFITQPQSSSQPLSAIQANPPPNAPGGEPQSGQAGNCSAINPASQNAALQITVRYNFVPLTPFVRQFTANSIILTAYTVYRTEY
ncbi:MAG: pilus assembly protein [Chloroflexi bacterium]|nr:MAG: pilus assembly protein [Chloroflexota bacterium]TME15701.1 MAG: pilus assembly protein [Chloroflexota bacterium]